MITEVGGREGGRIVREFGTGVYTLLYSKWIANKTYCIVQGTLLNITQQPKKIKEFGKEQIHVYV